MDWFSRFFFFSWKEWFSKSFKNQGRLESMSRSWPRYCLGIYFICIYTMVFSRLCHWWSILYMVSFDYMNSNHWLLLKKKKMTSIPLSRSELIVFESRAMRIPWGTTDPTQNGKEIMERWEPFLWSPQILVWEPLAGPSCCAAHS